jgi:hypothetical protein
MFQIILSILTIIGLIIAALVVVRKRKRAGITGIKSALPSICFFLIAVTNLLANWFNFLGVVSWGITIGLLIVGAYFTRYLPLPEEKTFS